MSDRKGTMGSGRFADTPEEWPTDHGWSGRLDDAVSDVSDSSAPVAAIIADGRRRQTRLRVVGGSALSVTALGLAVVVGTDIVFLDAAGKVIQYPGM